jgi:hypothetical protein
VKIEMKKLSTLIALFIFSASGAWAQRTTFQGTVVMYGSRFNTRTVTAPFSLTINGATSANDAARLIGVLRERGQSGLLSELDRSRGLGRLSLNNRVGHELGAVLVDDVDGKRRIRAITDRWIGFGELWRGSRSTDYPFTYIELIVDPRTGRGEGTFIAAAKVRFLDNKNTVEIEDFGTFPGRVMGVTMRGGRVP